MTATPTITDSELAETLSLIAIKMDKLRHRIAADEQLDVSETAQLAAAIEEITADTYRLADRLDSRGHGAAVRARVLATTGAEAAVLIRRRALRLVPRQ
jgi:hypothetical protein